jgi:tetratricopeptide (TPR) repeat protein
MRYSIIACVVAIGLAVSGCGPAKETAAPPPPATGAVTPQSLTLEGRRLYAEGELDSASAAVARALQLDSAYRPALEQQAMMFYDLMMREQKNEQRRLSASRTAREAYMHLERLGAGDADVCDRICELSLVLGDDRTFLRFAKKNAERFPYDRQVYNLGLAYNRTGDYAGAVRVLKEAAQKFPGSAYIAGFYRQLGRAYAGMDRDQTAERTYVAGVQAANARLAEPGNGASPAGVADRQRLTDDKIAMLLALKKLHQTYKHADRLQEVERQLKEAGYDK